MSTAPSNPAPLPNDGMTADTAPGQEAAQAESATHEADPNGSAATGDGAPSDIPAADVTADGDGDVDESDAGLPLGNAPLAGGEE